MNYSLALALSLATTALHATSFNVLKKALFDLDVTAVEKYIATNGLTLADKTRALALAQEIQKPYVPTKQFKLTGEDRIHLISGALLCQAGLLFSGKTIACWQSRPSINATTDIATLGFGIASITALYYGIRTIFHGHKALHAKEEMRKILSIIDTLQNTN